MDDETKRFIDKYRYNSYKDTLRIQVYLSDNSIDMEYTDKISMSELEFLFSTTIEYIKQKNEAATK